MTVEPKKNNEAGTYRLDMTPVKLIGTTMDIIAAFGCFVRWILLIGRVIILFVFRSMSSVSIVLISRFLQIRDKAIS